MENKKINQTVDHQKFKSDKLNSFETSGKKVLTEPEKIELISDDVQEILGRVPPGIVRWGISVIFIFLMGIIAGSFVFKYSDVMISSVVVLSENPPVNITAQSTGSVQYLLVRNNQNVKIGNVLAVIENTANFTEIEAISAKLDSCDFNKIDSIGTWPKFSYNLSLGNVQTPYSTFISTYSDYINFMKIDLFEKKVISLRQQQADYSIYLKRLKTQADYIRRGLNISHNQYKRDSLIFFGGIKSAMAPAEFEKSEQVYLQSHNIYESILASIATTEMQMNQIDYQVIEQKNQKETQKRKFISTLKDACDNLKASITSWELTYLLRSPIDGKITFTNIWSVNQQVITGDLLFTIVPDKPRKIIAKVTIPIAGSGKIEKGQRVNIKLDNFPYMEYGMLEGTLTDISLVPVNNQTGVFYSAEVDLPKGLTTSYGKKLPLNQEMRGTAEIITKDLSLFSRLINPLLAAISQNK